MNITPEDNHEPVFNAAQHTLSDVSHVLPVGLDIGLVYQDLVVNFTDLDAESTPAVSTGMDGRVPRLEVMEYRAVHLVVDNLLLRLQ